MTIAFWISLAALVGVLVAFRHVMRQNPYEAPAAPSSVPPSEGSTHSEADRPPSVAESRWQSGPDAP